MFYVFRKILCIQRPENWMLFSLTCNFQLCTDSSCFNWICRQVHCQTGSLWFIPPVAALFYYIHLLLLMWTEHRRAGQIIASKELIQGEARWQKPVVVITNVGNWVLSFMTGSQVIRLKQNLNLLQTLCKAGSICTLGQVLQSIQDLEICLHCAKEWSSAVEKMHPNGVTQSYSSYCLNVHC